MASQRGLYKRKDRSDWQVDTTYKGVRLCKGTGCESKADAARKVQEWKAQIDSNLEASRLSISERLTLKQAATNWWEEHRQFTDEADGARGAKWKIDKLVNLVGPSKRLEDLTTKEMAALVAKMRVAGAAPSTINWYLATMRSIWGYALEVWEYPVKPIAWKRIRQKEPETTPVVVSPRQLNVLLGLASGRLHDVAKFAVLTGLRKVEISRLTWSDVRLDDQEITLPDGSVKLMSVLRIKGKGGKTTDIPLNTEAVLLLSSIPRRNSLKVFDMVNFRKEWDAARIEAGLQHITFHTLRHAHATILDNMNAPIQGIQRLLRHSDISTTLIYANADARAALPYLERLGEMFSASPPKRSKAK